MLLSDSNYYGLWHCLNVPNSVPLNFKKPVLEYQYSQSHI